MSVNAAATVLEALSAYDTTPVPLASLVSTTTMVPQASSENVDEMVPPALSANTSTSMDVNATNMSTLAITEVDEKAMAEIYS